MVRWRSTAAAIALVALAGCSASAQSATRAPKLRLGYFPNLTHAPAIVGVEKGFFDTALAGTGRLDPTIFNAGPEAVQALFSKALDIAYIGPNPAINAYVQSRGAAIGIIAGAVSGGAALVVRPGIWSAADLRGKTLASPQLGNTQDVALRAWLKTQGLETTLTGGGAVKIKPQSNAQTLETFIAGQIDGAWVPEPWATRLVLEGKGRVLVDEKALWPDGRFVTTQVIVRTVFLRNHPNLVMAFLQGHLAAIDYLNANAGDAQTVVNAALKRLTGKSLKQAIIVTAWRGLTFTPDPMATSLRKAAEDAHAEGLLKRVKLDGIYALDILNSLLTKRGSPRVAA